MSLVDVDANYFKFITVSLVDTQVNGGYVEMKFPIPKQFLDIIQGKYKTDNGFTIDDDPEHIHYAVSPIPRDPYPETK
jgi:hypothetical protein